MSSGRIAGLTADVHAETGVKLPSRQRATASRREGLAIGHPQDRS